MVASLVDIFVRLVFALCLTILIEWGISCVFLRSKLDRQIVILVQCLTNPILNILVIINYHFNLFNPMLVLAILEVFVVLIEAIIYKTSLSDRTKVNPFMMSILLNISSFSIGLLIDYFV
jgi:hypothetical protein